MLLIDSKCQDMDVSCTLLCIFDNFYNKILEKHLQNKKGYYIILKQSAW